MLKAASGLPPVLSQRPPLLSNDPVDAAQAIARKSLGLLGATNSLTRKDAINNIGPAWAVGSVGGGKQSIEKRGDPTMKRELLWLHVWDDGGVVHVSIQRGSRHRIYRPSRGLVKWLSEVASDIEVRKRGAFVPSIAGLGWSWKPIRQKGVRNAGNV